MAKGPNALAMHPRGGRKLPLPGGQLRPAGQAPAGVQDAQCAHDAATMRQQGNPYTFASAGPEWLRQRERQRQQKQLDALLQRASTEGS